MVGVDEYACPVPTCDFKTVSNETRALQMEEMRYHMLALHQQLQHPQGGGHHQQTKTPKAGECPKWMESHPFEIWGKELNVWKVAAIAENISGCLQMHTSERNCTFMILDFIIGIII